MLFRSLGLAGWLALSGVGCGGATRGGATPSTGGHGGAAGSGGASTGGAGAGGAGIDASVVDVSADTAAALDAPSDVAPSTVDTATDRSADAVRACVGGSALPASNSCHSVADCGPIGPVKCCTGSPCWPASACPLAPILCASITGRFQCMVDSDCATKAGGKCVSTISGCPQCEYRNCQYPPDPPPACTQSPDSCAPSGRCQSNGTCAPVLCTEGTTCSVGSRCNVGSARANASGCELIPCNAGWACTENTRCTAPNDPASHGCLGVSCNVDADCDCGYCVNGGCAANLGFCSQAPQ